MADSLRAELMAIDGIAAAELEGGEDSPLGVRVQLAAGADAESVGIAVEKVLASHGMRSHRAEGDEAPKAQAASQSVSGPPPPPGAGGEAAIVPIRGALGASVEAVVAPQRELPLLESVAVEESRTGTSVRVTVGGREISRQVGSTAEGRDAAIVAAVAEALGAEAELITVQRGQAGEAKIITALVEIAGGGQQVGSAVVSGGEAYALASAAWKALTAQE